jgi:hypothetical protein
LVVSFLFFPSFSSIGGKGVCIIARHFVAKVERRNGRKVVKTTMGEQIFDESSFENLGRGGKNAAFSQNSNLSFTQQQQHIIA